MSSEQSMEIKELYEKDFLAWTEKISESIKEKNFDDMDWDNLIEEVEDMGKSEKRTARAALKDTATHKVSSAYSTEQEEIP